MAILAALPVMVVLALGGLWYRGQSALNSELAALRARGFPTKGSELNEFYMVPEGVADTTALWVKAIDAVKAANLRERAGTLPLVGTGPTPIPEPGEIWGDLEGSQALLGELSEEMQAIRRAASAGGQVRFPVDFTPGIDTLLPYTQEARDAAKLLALDAWVSAHDRKGPQALDDVRGIFALSNALRGEPTQISQLVRIAIHVIGCDATARLMPHCSWSDAELKALQTIIQSAHFKAEMATALCGERATQLTTLEAIPLGPLRQPTTRKLLHFFEGTIEGYSSSWPEILRRQRERAAEIRTGATNSLDRFEMTFVELLAPAIEQAAVAGARAEARQKCTTAAIAVERFRLQHDRLPESLAEVESLIPQSATGEVTPLTDPFDGSPLRYKVEEMRYMIYSIGPNELDDRGDLLEREGPGPQHPPDVGVSIKR